MQVEITRNRLSRFETAQETIGFMMAMRTEVIYNEEQKVHPDAAKIEQWNREFDQLANELYELHLNDDAAIQRVLDEYCPIVKADYESRRVEA